MLSIACPACHEQFGLPLTIAGKVFSCPACGSKTIVPRPEEVHRPGPTVRSTADIGVTCLRCARLISVPPDKGSGWLACPSCSLVFLAVSPAAPPRPRPTPPPLPAPLPLPEATPRKDAKRDEDDDEDDDEVAELRRRRRRKAKRKSLRFWLVVGGVMAGLVILVLWLGGIGGRVNPFQNSKTRELEMRLKHELEYEHGIPVESVELVPYRHGYTGVVTTKKGQKFDAFVVLQPDGTMSYHVR